MIRRMAPAVTAAHPVTWAKILNDLEAPHLKTVKRPRDAAQRRDGITAVAAQTITGYSVIAMV
jgi:hypothetical protein|tara:strand:+ start:961 stop:1149 length:189 start_codon:yes stop_codon:yes gene_type:complete